MIWVTNYSFYWKAVARSFLAVLGIFFIFSSAVAAQGILPGELPQTNPKDRPVDVTAVVPVQDAPPPPILITPPNNSTLRSGVVLFEWRGVDHIADIDRYELYLNGEQKFGSIHTTDQETDNYILTYDAEEDIYSLQLKPDKWLPDGVYTWKIRVIDENDRGTDSTTWTFTIDSTPPPIIVTEIDDDPYAISASDPSTFPDEPIVVTDQSPLILGNSESGAELQLVVRYPDGTTWQTYTTTVSTDGSFQIQLGNLPVDVIMHLTFTAIDFANNSTVLDAIDLVYRPREIVIPIPDIFPFPLTIRVRIPGRLIELPEIEFPEIPGFRDEEVSPVTPPPTEQIFTRPVQPRGLFILGAWFGLGWYVLALFWLTGNSWSWFRHFLSRLMRLWIFVSGPEKSWLFVRQRDAEALPFLAYTMRWLTDTKQYQEWSGCTSCNGFGAQELPLNALTHVQSYSRRYVYSVDRVGAEGSTTVAKKSLASVPTGSLVLQGEDFLISSQTTSPRQIDEYAMVLPSGKVIVLALQSVRSEELASWKIWLPQAGLVLGILSALWLAYLLPTWWSFALLVLLVWIGFRDAMVQMHKRMKVYAKAQR